jgi:hypothetical protein
MSKKTVPEAVPNQKFPFESTKLDFTLDSKSGIPSFFPKCCFFPKWIQKRILKMELFAK